MGDAVRLVPVLAHAARRPDDVTKEHVRHAPRDAAGVLGRERGHHVVARAESVVLVPVLDVRDGGHVKKPRVEPDSRAERLGVPRVSPAVPCVGASEQRRPELILHGVPVKLEVVIAVHDVEGVAVGHEVRKRVEHVSMTSNHHSQLHAHMVSRVAEPVCVLLAAPLGGQLGSRRMDGHSDEVDEVPRKDEAHVIARWRRGPVVREQLHEVLVDAPRTADRLDDVVQVAAEVHVREDHHALHASAVAQESDRARSQKASRF